MAFDPSLLEASLNFGAAPAPLSPLSATYDELLPLEAPQEGNDMVLDTPTTPDAVAPLQHLLAIDLDAPHPTLAPEEPHVVESTAVVQATLFAPSPPDSPVRGEAPVTVESTQVHHLDVICIDDDEAAAQPIPSVPHVNGESSQGTATDTSAPQATTHALANLPLKFPLPTKPLPVPTTAPTAKVADASTVTTPTSATLPQVKKPATSKLAQMKQRIEADPNDGEAWLELLADAEKKGDLDKTREIYKGFLQHFPDASAQWMAYANLELGHGHFHEVEMIFSECLRNSVSVELWAFYLNYIRRVNPIEGEKAAISKQVISQAYEFSLTHVGIDRESGNIWTDYLDILKTGEAAGTWQEQQKMDSLRKVYQRAVCIPLNIVEQIWREYDQFENSVSKMTAKKFLGEKSPQYMTARTALREMKTLTDKLHRPKVSKRPDWTIASSRQHIDAWKTYLRWEESNPLELEDATQLQVRIHYAYRHATMHMRFFPEIWYMASNNLLSVEKVEEALTLLQSALVANPASITLTFALVERQEVKKAFPECYKLYDVLVEHMSSDIEKVKKELDAELNQISIANTEINGGGDAGEMDHELTDEEQKRVKEDEEKKKTVQKHFQPRIDELQEDLASIWIHEMRFAYRSEGNNAARTIFKKARDSSHRTRHIFIAAANMEFHWNKSADIARNIFGLGLKYFSEDVEFVTTYLDFLIGINDDANARALFEKTVSKMSAEHSQPLWQRWASYEYWNGDAAAGEKLDARIAELFPETTAIERFAGRNTYVGLQGVFARELGTVSGAAAPIVEAVKVPVKAAHRAPSPVPSHLQGFGFRSMNINNGNSSETVAPSASTVGIPPRPKKGRDRSWSPEGRNQRSRGRDFSPERRERGGGAGRRGRFESPPLSQGPPPKADPYAWFPEALRFFLSVLPASHSFDGPRLDAVTVLQVLRDADLHANISSHGAGGQSGWAASRRGGRR